MKESFVTLDTSFRLLSVSQGLTGKMAGMTAITTFINQMCMKLYAMHAKLAFVGICWRS